MYVGATELSLSLSLTGRTTAESSAGSRPWDKGVCVCVCVGGGGDPCIGQSYKQQDKGQHQVI